MTIQLSINQSLKLMNNKYASLRIKRGGKVFYIENCSDGSQQYSVSTWGGAVQNILVLSAFSDTNEYVR
jgi:hypothetical protein